MYDLRRETITLDMYGDSDYNYSTKRDLIKFGQFSSKIL